MTRVALLAAAFGLAVLGGCRSDAPREVTRRDPPGPLGRLTDWPVPGNFPALDRAVVRSGGSFWTTLDLDGDGRLDLVRTADEGREGPAPWTLHRNAGAGFGPGIEWAVPSGGYPGQGFLTADYQSQGSADGTELWRTVDLDGDRRPDLVITGRQEGGVRRVLGYPDAPHWRVHHNLGDGFAAAAVEVPVPAAAALVTRGEVQVGHAYDPQADGVRGRLFDLDGDGRTDLVATTTAEGLGAREVPGFHTRETRWRFFRNTGAGFAPSAAWPVPDLNRGAELTPLGGLYAPEGEELLQGGVAWTLAELTGDGRPDLVVTGAPGAREVPGLSAGAPHWEVYANTGRGFAPSPRRFPVPPLPSEAGATGPFSVANSELWALLDFDGDGRADLLQTGVPSADLGTTQAPGFPDAPAWSLHRNEGEGFASVATTIGLPEGGGLDAAGFRGSRQDGVQDESGLAVHSWRVVDVDGDRRADLLWVLARTGLNVSADLDDEVLGYPDAPYWLVSFQDRGH